MSRQVWKGSTLLNPEPPVLVSCGSPDKPNLITVGWTGTICTQPPMLSISVRPERYSHHLIQESGEFVVNLPTESLVRAIDWCGVKSGRDVDKFAAMHLTAAPAAKVETARTVHSENEIIRRAQQYITANIRSKLSVPMVAQNVDVSPSYLTALFRKNMQISPGEYIRRMKLQESKQMIRENNMSFTDIAAALHYSTVHHFSRQFKEKFGITPTEYARSVRG